MSLDFILHCWSCLKRPEEDPCGGAVKRPELGSNQYTGWSYQQHPMRIVQSELDKATMTWDDGP
jgi:hypothetical protein